jgi:hypothetical protein
MFDPKDPELEIENCKMQIARKHVYEEMHGKE